MRFLSSVKKRLSSPLTIAVALILAVTIAIIFTLAMDTDGGGREENDSPIASTTKTKKTASKPALRPGNPTPYTGDLLSVAQLNVRDAVVEQLLKGLKFPWAFEFISPEDLLITTLHDGMWRFNIKTRKLTEIQGLPKIPGGRNQIGLMDVALHPDFGANGRIYITHAVSGETPNTLAMALTTATLEKDSLLGVTQLLIATPFGKSPSNFGGALAFDDQGYLYVATGDRSDRDKAQAGQHLTGKVLRLLDDGGVPTDNPFVGDPTVDNRIFALGVRNPQGLVFDHKTGALFETEHGPMGGDEINVIRAGANYGWPVITYGANYTTQRIGLGTYGEGYEQPLFYYLPSVAVSPITVYRGEMFTEWDGDLLVGSLKGSKVHKLDLVDGQIKSEQRMLNELKGRIRDIKVAADGSLFFLLQNQGRIFRLYRSADLDSTELPLERPARTVYELVCRSCHGPGAISHPELADKDTWQTRLNADPKLLLERVLNGYGSMPAKGACDACTDDEISAALDHMLATQKKNSS